MYSIDFFAIWRNGLGTAQPILTALATVGSQEDPIRFGDDHTAFVSIASHCKLVIFSICLHCSRMPRYSFNLVSISSGLCSHLVILSPIREYILRHFIACVHSSMKVGLLIGWPKLSRCIAEVKYSQYGGSKYTHQR